MKIFGNVLLFPLDVQTGKSTEKLRYGCNIQHTQFVEALLYKPEGCGFDSRWGHWNFSLIFFFRPHYGPGVDLGSNRNEYQENFLGVKVTGA